MYTPPSILEDSLRLFNAKLSDRHDTTSDEPSVHSTYSAPRYLEQRIDRNPVPDPSSRIRLLGIRGWELEWEREREREMRYWDRWRDASQVFNPVVPDAERTVVLGCYNI